MEELLKMAKELHAVASDLENAAKEQRWNEVRALANKLAEDGQHLSYSVTIEMSRNKR